MASLNSLSFWSASTTSYPYGANHQCATEVKVTAGDKITSVEINLAHISKTVAKNILQKETNTDKGRKVKCGIWVNQKSSYTIVNPPAFLSDNEVDTDTLPLIDEGDSITFKTFEFTFNDGKGIDFTTVSSIYIGLVSDLTDMRSANLCFQINPNSGRLIVKHPQEDYSTNIYTGSLYMNINYETVSYTSKPPLHITGIQCRTLSKSSQRSESVSDSDPRMCNPLPTADSTVICQNNKNQWNKNFDFSEGLLRDVYYEHTEDKLIWLHTRSRAKISIAKLPESFKYDSNNYVQSGIEYYVVQSTTTNKNKRISYSEVSGQTNTLIICPRDEGIGDNEPMDVVLRRYTIVYGKKNYGNEVTLKFYTYAEPTVDIAYPKNMGVGTGNESNYVLWATEVCNDPFTKSRDASSQICAALNLLLTKDGGDDSGLPIHTRIYIAEYPGEYDKEGKFPTPSNEDIYEGYAQMTASWRGIQLDDGSLIQLSGLQPQGYTWEKMCEDGSRGSSTWDIDGVYEHRDPSSNVDYYYIKTREGNVQVRCISNGSTETWATDFRNNGELNEEDIQFKVNRGTGSSYKCYYNRTGDDVVDNKVIKIIHPTKYPHYVRHNASENSDSSYYSIDRRMYFRSGYKYMIKVRRFHSSVAGVLGCIHDINSHSYNNMDTTDQSRTCYDRYIDKFTHSSGGCYQYIGNTDFTDQKHLGKDGYYGSRSWTSSNGRISGSIGGNDDSSGTSSDFSISGTYWNGYPIIDDAQWINLNNKLLERSLDGKSVDNSLGLILENTAQDKSITCRQIWVGPDDGSSGLITTDSRIDEVYPGFSKADSIIIDCVAANTTSGKIITPRPAAQEVGADHWITFAYRHLSKDTVGIDAVAYTQHKQNFVYSRSQLDPDGRMPSEVMLYSDSIKQSHFGKTWSGHDNTATRIGHMYMTMLKHIFEKAKARNVHKTSYGCYSGTDPKTVEVDYDYFTFKATVSTSNAGEIEIVSQQSNGVDVQYTSSNNVTDLNFSSNTFMKDFNEYYKQWETSSDRSSLAVKMNEGNNTYGTEGFIYTPNYFIFDKSDINNVKYGNTYKWIPVINDSTYKNSSFSNVSPCGQSASIQTNVNFKDITMAYSGDCATEYVPLLYNKYQPEWDLRLDGYGERKPNSSDTKVNAQGGNNACILEYNENNGYLFTSPWSSTTNIKNASGAVESKDEGGRQQFTNTSTWNNGVTSSSQRQPGKLFKRISPLQDCECGKVTADRVAIPTRIDAKYPLVRTSHYLWFQTYICGKINIEVTYYYTIHTSHEQKTNKEGKVTGYTCGPNETKSINKSLSDIAPEIQSVGKGVMDSSSVTHSNILTVYGEDNAGLGRCLSADDTTALWYNQNGHPKNIHTGDGMCGGIEVPIRVRYTPLVQPIITTDKNIIGKKTVSYNGSYPVTNKNSNVIKLINSSTESGSVGIQDNLKGKSGFTTQISYGMFRSAMGGNYISKEIKPTESNLDRGIYNYLQLTTPSSSALPKKQEDSGIINTIIPTDPSRWDLFNSDNYPSVGICNAFLVVLVPNDAVDSRGRKLPPHTKHEANFFSKRSNYETAWKSKSNPSAKPVIVADLAKTEVYKYMSMENGMAGAYASECNDVNSNYYIPASTLDHNLRTLFNCTFDYADLRRNKSNSVISSVSDSDIKTKKNNVVTNVWYDLLVVPIFTNRSGFGSDEKSMFNGSDYTFQYTDGDGTFGENKTPFAGGSSSQKTVDYYGSTPLVINKFLKIASDTYSGGGGSSGGGGGTPTPTGWVDPLFATQGCIMFPNVNNRLYGNDNGLIKEPPGFWTNNTFRLICRAPHFRCESDINAYVKGKGGNATYETTLEEATSYNEQEGTGLTKGQSNEFQWTDCMIHFGKYNDIVKVYDYASGTFKDDENGWTFNSREFQDALDANAQNTEWLNERMIFTMRSNPGAFSKCTPEAKANGDERDIILGGGLTSKDEGYADRFFVFNPSIVDAKTPYPEGYYIQMRFLNAEYPSTSQGSLWTAWYGGLKGGGTIEGKEITNKDLIPYDTDLDYCVPVRDRNNIHTGFMHYIKESTPGSGLMLHSNSKPDKAVNGITNPYEDLYAKGSGSESKVANAPVLPDYVMSNREYIAGSGNYHDPDEDSYNKAKETVIAPEDFAHKIKSDGENISNNDYPYPPAITIGKSYDQYSGFEIPERVKEFHQTYWEMNYVDYLVRNMAKLYQSDWSEAIPPTVKTKVTHIDTGWTRAKALAYGTTFGYNRDPNNMSSLKEDCKWSSDTFDVDLSHLRKDAETTNAKIKDKPLNVNRYFRKNVTYKDFECLNTALQHIVDFMRDEIYTGTHTESTDPKHNGVPMGTSVLPVSSESLNFNELRTTTLNGPTPVGNYVIGHDVDMNIADDHNNNQWRRVDSNFAQKIMTNIATKVTADSTVSS